MKHKPKRSPAAGDFLFEIDSAPLEECVTVLGGVRLLARAIRSLDVPGSVQRHLRIKHRDRGLDEATYVESFLVLNAVGGDCLEDFDPLREDAGLVERLGYRVSSAEAARKFLYHFYDESKIEPAQRGLGEGRLSYLPEESAPLQGLAAVNREAVQDLGRRCPEPKIATLDVDATIIESWKREAKLIAAACNITDTRTGWGRSVLPARRQEACLTTRPIRRLGILNSEMGTTDRSFTGQTQDMTLGLYDFTFRQQARRKDAGWSPIRRA
jgi:hypothetical protein